MRSTDSTPDDGCARAGGRGGPRGRLLASATAGPVVCRDCGSRFGRGAEAGTVCPVCGGPLCPLPAQAGTLGGDPLERIRKEDAR